MVVLCCNFGPSGRGLMGGGSSKRQEVPQSVESSSHWFRPTDGESKSYSPSTPASFATTPSSTKSSKYAYSGSHVSSTGTAQYLTPSLLSDASSSPSPAHSRVRRKRSAVEEIRYQAEQTANRAAERRSQLLAAQGDFPGVGRKLSNREQLLLSIGVRAPELQQATTSALSVKWETERSAGAARIKYYELQWRLSGRWSASPTRKRHGEKQAGIVNAWVVDRRHTDVGDEVLASSRVHFIGREDWCSVPENAVDNLKLCAHVCGLPNGCPAVRFRVRGRCNAGWGPWSGVSAEMETLPRAMSTPVVGTTTESTIEIRWKGVRDKRYGRLKKYILLGKTSHPEDTWKECYTGMQPKLVLSCMGVGGLVPKTEYILRVVGITTHSTNDDAPEWNDSALESASVTASTAGTRPAVPQPPKIETVTHESVTLSWCPPHSNGSPITSYQVMGKTGRSHVYTEWYSGIQTRHTVGAARSNSRNFSAIRILPATEYNVKVLASNAYGQSKYSNPIMVVTEPAPASRVSGSDGSQNIDGNITELPVLHETTVRHSEHASFEMLESLDPSVAGGEPGPLQDASLQNMPGERIAGHPPVHRELPTGTRSDVVIIEGGWMECWDQKQQALYYFHPHSGCTQWEHPSKVKADPDLVFRRKRFRFLYLLHKSDAQTGAQPVLPLSVDRATVVYSSYKQLHIVPPSLLRCKPRVTFLGEAGIDSGGVSKDWFLNLSRSFADPQLCLFSKNSEGGEQLYEIDARSSINSEHLEYFRFVGRVLGMAIFHRNLVDLRFPNWLYKHLLDRRISLVDIAESDPVFHKSMQWILNNDLGAEGCSFDFSVTKKGFGTVSTVELIPDGKNISVTEHNKDLYVSLLLQWHVEGRIEEQVRCLKQGFCDVIPSRQVTVFDPHELMLLLNGKSIVNDAEIRAVTVYTGGYDRESYTVEVSQKEKHAKFRRTVASLFPRKTFSSL